MRWDSYFVNETRVVYMERYGLDVRGIVQLDTLESTWESVLKLAIL